MHDIDFIAECMKSGLKQKNRFYVAMNPVCERFHQINPDKRCKLFWFRRNVYNMVDDGFTEAILEYRNKEYWIAVGRNGLIDINGIKY